MIKCIWAISFNPAMERDDAIRHWREVHGGLVRQVPGLHRYVQNLVVEQLTPGWDGLAELWFDDQAAYDAATASDLWAEITADCDTFLDQGRTLAALVEETDIVAPADGPPPV